ncbi:transporter substrate-binding domain-containing protein [Neiella sp. HB171785]|uniref:Transporter substrate-binding domain-containing protein n=1 Tax=Neiella litorisoli TaxID=2771431 RepID=A0A8J6UFY9_9GAMM|nr:transporter substrate-binding domain-containing protein [Neiella litorisoli]MBD1391334.1 transporter substrate-binding domain-containing protein [Neiella litorisoli]
MKFLQAPLIVCVAILGVLIKPAIASSCQHTVTHPPLESSKDQLIFSLLSLALSKTDADICYQQLQLVVTEARKSALINSNQLSVQWASAGSSADTYADPIKQPIFFGLTGFRVLVIRQGEQHRFDNIKSADDLKQLRVGQGLFWGDTQLLQRAGFDVVTTAQARRLWKMLASHRFDYISLGAHEPWKDIALRPELNLTVEQNLLLVYPSVLYFYVSPQRPQLKALISQGMARATTDGSYQQLLRQSEMIQSLLAHANISQRRQIQIHHAELSKLLPEGYVMELPAFLLQSDQPSK